VGLLERLAELGKALMTTEAELKHLRETLSEVRQDVRMLTADVQEVRERLVRLETSREADLARLEAEVSRFKAEVERTASRLARLQPAPEKPPLPPASEG
jgi:predicted  nucleic acid-binding Zn-ribbon protein